MGMVVLYLAPVSIAEFWNAHGRIDMDAQSRGDNVMRIRRELYFRYRGY